MIFIFSVRSGAKHQYSRTVDGYCLAAQEYFTFFSEAILGESKSTGNWDTGMICLAVNFSFSKLHQ